MKRTGRHSNRLLITPAVIAALIVMSWFGAAAHRQAASPPAKTLFQQALHEEEANGNLAAAIALYERALAAAGTDRALAAEALVRMADCQRLLGKATAHGLYERVVKEFADQKESVARAQARLAPAERMVEPNRRVWTMPADADAVSAVSYDGRYVAYVDWSDAGKADLFVHPLAGGLDRRLTTTRNVVGTTWKRSAKVAAFSRDGEQVAYSWVDVNTNRYQLLIAGLKTAGSAPRLLADVEVPGFVDPYDWTPDGLWIAAVWKGQDKDSPRKIGLVSTRDGSLRELESINRPCACTLNVMFSPDGQYLAFDLPGADTKTRDIFAVDITSGHEIPVAQYKADDALVGWSPDGRSIIFSSDRRGAMDLLAAPFSDGQFGQATAIQADLGAFVGSGITASGAVYYCRCVPQSGSDVKVASFDFATGTFTSPPVDAVQQFTGTNNAPMWSPDGSAFTYVSSRPNRDAILAIQDTASGDVHEIRPKLLTFFSPRWTLDGRSILVFGTDFQKQFGWRQIDVATGTMTPVIIYPAGSTNWIGPMAPESFWSADNRAFTFRRRLNGVSITLVEVDLASGEEHVLVELPRTDTLHAQRSVDGRTLYYRRPADGATEFSIVARDLSSGAERELLHRSNLGGFNRSPDGRWLGLSVRPSAEGPGAVLLLPTAGGDPIELLRGTGMEEIGSRDGVINQLSIGPGTWSPDSRSMIVRKDATPDQVEFWWVPIDGRAPRRLDEFQGLNPEVLRVHPDGHRILFGAKPTVVTPPQPTELRVIEGVVKKQIKG